MPVNGKKLERSSHGPYLMEHRDILLFHFKTALQSGLVTPVLTTALCSVQSNLVVKECANIKCSPAPLSKFDEK